MHLEQDTHRTRPRLRPLDTAVQAEATGTDPTGLLRQGVEVGEPGNQASELHLNLRGVGAHKKQFSFAAIV